MKLLRSVSSVLSLGLLLSAGAYAQKGETKALQVREPETPSREAFTVKMQEAEEQPKRREESMQVVKVPDESHKFVKTVKSEGELIDALNSHQNVAFHVGAEWCGACKMLHKPLATAAEKYRRDIKVYDIDADNSAFKPFLKFFKVTGLPTLILIRKETGSRTTPEVLEIFGEVTGARQLPSLPMIGDGRSQLALPAPEEGMMLPEPSRREQARARREARRSRRRPTMQEMGFPMGDMESEMMIMR